MSNQERRPTPDDIPEQQLAYPASQADMVPAPDSDLSNYRPADKLKGKVAIITGGDSGIGRAVAIAYAMEGAKVAILYNVHDDDASVTQSMVEERGGQCLPIKMDVRKPEECRDAVKQTVDKFGGLNVLVNNAAFQMTQKKLEDLTEEQFRQTLGTNVLGYFHMVKAALPHLEAGDVIINTGSIVGKLGKGMLIDYATSKGAVHAMTKSLAQNLVDRQIRVNSVVPGPVWTPNIPATMPVEKVGEYDTDNQMERAGQPEELAPAYVFFAAEDSSFVTGALLDVAGGMMSS
ncbi:SDR family oxidoreductase [Romeria aff. gracilis LEGE 07310]|uniref:SDR family oxidoreductase n=1 Tax=Vasconcelosia minhoensis LEGE 07310 TaxID=915328 RepID=A0A8J7A891_9CYAN|nr:SDR family oxidoreductase [Romeria gracilis]MBE9077905.1 SDR family oxidoreductase [Romeria aff. gracilis LEGE 07310]